MLRRVKTDVVSELTSKTEITVHCKLSTRQQAFYQAIKNKISLAELFDSNRGHLNEKKILNLMNIVIQLRKVSYVVFYCCLFLLAPYCFKYVTLQWSIGCEKCRTCWNFVCVIKYFPSSVSVICNLSNCRSATIQSYLRGVREARFFTLVRFQILFCPHLLGSWRRYTTQDVIVL